MAVQSPTTRNWRGRPVWAEIDLDALAHNVRNLKRQAGEAMLAAVIKADAYGHGAVAVARAALEAGAERLAVICVDEGEQLRRAGIQAPILVMGYSPIEDAARIVELRLTPTIISEDMALALAAQAGRAGVRQPLHLKVDTGLNRYGLPPQEVVALAKNLRNVAPLQVEGVYTHFATADDADKEFTREQYAIFQRTAAQIPWVPVRHVSNSANLLDLPEMNLEMVRPGLGVYGLYPSRHVNKDLHLQPILSLKSRIARLTPLSPHDTVSYGRTWQARRPSLIGLVMCGYADGLPRAVSNQGSVLVRGQRAPIVGRVCMDMCMIDVTDIHGVAVEDEVALIGSQGEETISADEVAGICETISWEILCGISQRVPRLYIEHGELVRAETLVSTIDTNRDGAWSRAATTRPETDLRFNIMRGGGSGLG